MLIKKLPGAARQSRSFDPDAGRAADADASRLLPAAALDDPTAGTAQLDALRQALGVTAILSRNTVLQGRYEVEQVLGVGGMSTVYRARDLRFSNVVRYCAVKEMPNAATDPTIGALRFANFEREASLLATLSHPGIPKIYDFFSEDGRVYLVLEYIEGSDLEALLDERQAPVEEQVALRWAMEICDVLSYLHSRRPQPIIFRDLKPSNIMVDLSRDKITLIDFGIAKTLQTDRKGTMIGTEGYSPPEQYRGLSEPRGDIYALGATLHHLLTNSDPRAETPFTFHDRPIRKLNPEAGADTQAVVMRALEYDAARRWDTAGAVKAALQSVLDARKRGGQTPLVAPAAAPAAAPPAPAPLPAPVPEPRRGAGTAMTPPLAGPAQARRLWVFTAEDEIRSSPVVAGGRVYVGSYDSNLYALDAETGALIWKRATEAGICSSPLALNDLVIVGSEDNRVYALDAQRGTVAWTYTTGGPIRSSPRLSGEQVVIGSDDQYLYCLDIWSGRLLWKYRAWGPIRSSAAFGKTLIYVGCADGNLYAIDRISGSMKWKFHSSGPITSSPVAQDGLVYVGSADQNFYALDGDTGWAVWKHRTAHYVTSSPALSDGQVFVGSVDGCLYALDARSGRVAWKYQTGSQITSSPRLAEGLVYFGAVDQHVYCLEQAQGDLRWQFATRGPVTSTPAVEDGRVYVGSLDHKLYALGE
jgi:eukaryotic-like serine/threonine-protein kinase